mmetsp:Transcript_5145/g.22187  ORF Transcript_5145/g.22187 Transcript_5145/m.22187 type:complete len:156 (-) Transcript_5145:432-899(-)
MAWKLVTAAQSIDSFEWMTSPRLSTFKERTPMNVLQLSPGNSKSVFVLTEMHVTVHSRKLRLESRKEVKPRGGTFIVCHRPTTLEYPCSLRTAGAIRFQVDMQVNCPPRFFSDNEDDERTRRMALRTGQTRILVRLPKKEAKKGGGAVRSTSGSA